MPTRRAAALNSRPDTAPRPRPEAAPGTDAARPDPVGLTAESFAELYRAHATMLWIIAAAVLGRRAHVEDVLQEAAVIALQKLDQFDPETNFAAWMGQIVRFVALNYGRKMARGRAGSVGPEVIDALAVEDEQHGAAAAVTGDGRIGDAQTSFDDRVLEALVSLEETARACLLLRTVLDKSYREISLALDIPEGTAMSHVHRARKAMRRMLEESPHDDETNDMGAQEHAR